MSITLKLVDGTQKSLDLPELGIAVSEFKRLCESVIGIPADEQRVVFRGKVLKDDDILSCVGMEHGNAVHIVRSKKKETSSRPTQASHRETASTPVSGSTTNSTNTNAPNPYEALFGTYAGSQPLVMNPENGPNLDANTWASAGMGSGWGQSSAEAMQMLQNPMIMQFFQEAMRNPAFMQQIMQYNPMFANMPSEIQQQAMQMMGNPELMRQAMSMYSAMGNMNSSSSNNPVIDSNGGNTSTSQRVPAGYTLPSFLPLQQPQGDPRVIYREQLQQLREMGFPNEDANIAALQQSQGNVSFAIERLFNA